MCSSDLSPFSAGDIGAAPAAATTAPAGAEATPAAPGGGATTQNEKPEKAG